MIDRRASTSLFLRERWVDQPLSVVIRRPRVQARDYWAGAPSVFQDRGSLFLTYRYRYPREKGRGLEARIAHSSDGECFEDIWSVHQDQLDTPSMERFALHRIDTQYLLYLSYVDPADGRWRVDRVTATDPSGFDVASRQPFLTAEDVGSDAVKDPVVVPAGGLYWMYLSIARRTPEGRSASPEELHQSQDVYTTGLTHSLTGLAVSTDGCTYDWLGPVLEPSAASWDSYTSRLSAVLRHDGLFLGFYDGSSSVKENYEERTGLAVSSDLTHWTKVTVTGPCQTGADPSGSLRYVAAAANGDQVLLYYECATSDGAHELRLTRLPLERYLPERLGALEERLT